MKHDETRNNKPKSQNLKRIDVPPASSTFWRPNGYPVDLSKLKADGSQFSGRESNVAPELLATVHLAQDPKMDPPVLAPGGPPRSDSWQHTSHLSKTMTPFTQSLAMNSSSDPGCSDVGHPINGIPRIMAISIPDWWPSPTGSMAHWAQSSKSWTPIRPFTAVISNTAPGRIVRIDVESVSFWVVRQHETCHRRTCTRCATKVVDPTQKGRVTSPGSHNVFWFDPSWYTCFLEFHGLIEESRCEQPSNRWTPIAGFTIFTRQISSAKSEDAKWVCLKTAYICLYQLYPVYPHEIAMLNSCFIIEENDDSPSLTHPSPIAPAPVHRTET